MKTTIKIKFALLSLLFVSLSLINCSDDETPANPGVSSNEIVNIPFFVRTADKDLPTNPGDLLYEFRNHEPIIAPDGHHVTWAEFSAVKGDIQVECVEAGTKVSIQLRGLIPHGVYTMWNVSVKAPGFDPNAELFNIIGIGAAGNGLGTDNSFIASANGTAEITTISQGGPLSMFGELADCPILNQFEWHVVGAIHLDGKTYGPNLGPDGTVAEQFGFIFKQQN